MDIPECIPPALTTKLALRTTEPALARDKTQVSLVQPIKRHAVPPNRAAAVSVIPPKLRPDTLATTLPVVEKLAPAVTSNGFGGETSMSKLLER